MKLLKPGRQRLFENDSETTATVGSMLLDLEHNGMEAVRRYSRKFDDWDPPSFRLTRDQIGEAIARVPEQAIRDTDYCQDNVRRFAEAQMQTLLPLEVELRPGVFLGHRHIPVNSAGSYIPGGRYPMFGSAQMSIIPARVAGVKHIVACTPPVKGQGYYPATINAIEKAGADAIYILGGVPALALMAFGLDGVQPVDMLCGAGNRFVAEAKRQLFGRCGIDLLAGPTEILVIADDDCRPRPGSLRPAGAGRTRPEQRRLPDLPGRGNSPAALSTNWRSSSKCCRRAKSQLFPGATTALCTSPMTKKRPPS